MIQSRFQKQHASKHPQHPENGGSGPKPMPASRDATSNIRRNGTKGYKDGELEKLESTAAYWDKTAGELNPPGRYAAGEFAKNAREKVPDATKRKAAAAKTRKELGLGVPVHFGDDSGEWTENMDQDDVASMHTLLDDRKYEPPDSAVHGSQSFRGRKQPREGREDALRGAAAKARARADAELDTAFNQYGGKLGQATYGDKAGADYKRSDALNAEADSLFRGRTRGKKK